MAAAAVVLALAGAGLSRIVEGGGPADHSAGSALACPALLFVGDQTFSANGDPVRLPRPGRLLRGVRAVARPCVEPPQAQDQQTPSPAPPHQRRVPVFAIPGVDPSQAFFTGEAVWVNTSFPQLPVPLREFYTRLPCTSPGTRTLTGHLVGSDARVTADYHPVTPYTATFEADHGRDLGLDRYSVVTVRLQVTAQTRNGADPGFLRAALGRGRRAAVEVTCDAGRYLAVGFDLR